MAKRKQGKRHPPGLEKLLDQARRNEQQPSRKHHVVPKSYLERWEVRGVLRATAVTSRESHRISARKIARETDFYRIESEDIDAEKIPPLLFETLLGEIEGHAVEAIDVLLEHGFDGFERDPSLGGWLTLFMAFQLTRGNRYRQEHRAVVNAGMLEIYGHVTDEGIAARIEESGEEPTPEKVAEHRAFIEGWKRGEYFVAPQDAELIGTGASVAGEIAPMIGQRQWLLYRAPVDLITCDEPVVAVGGPEISRRTLGGIGTAGVLLFPLDPRTLLAMFHPWVELSDVSELLALTYEEVGEINLEIATSGHRWLIERPHTTQTRVIPLPIPRTAFALEELPTGDPLRTFIHTYRPSRWAMSATPPPWPVARWWPSGAAASATED